MPPRNILDFINVRSPDAATAEVEFALATCARLKIPPPFAIQNEFSLLHQAEQAEVLKLCDLHALAFTAFSPLASGMLAGRYQWGQELPKGSRWDVWSKRRPFPSYWTESSFSAVKKLDLLAQEMCTTSAALALAWCFRHPQIAITLVGPRIPSHLEAVRAAVKMELSDEQFSKIQGFFV